MTHTATLAANAQAELTARLAALQEERALLCSQMSEATRSDGMGDQTEAQISIELVSNQIQAVMDRLAALKTTVPSVRFTVEDEDGATRVYTIVHPELSDAAQGLVSPTSPFGRALANADVGDSVTVRTPKGAMELVVLSVERGV